MYQIIRVSRCVISRDHVRDYESDHVHDYESDHVRDYESDYLPLKPNLNSHTLRYSMRREIGSTQIAM